MKQARALAFVRGRNYVLPQDVLDMALDVMRHRLVRRAAVLGTDGALLGIVSADDIVKLLTLEMSLISDAISKQPVLEGRMRS